jgi:hypothetical protein
MGREEPRTYKTGPRYTYFVSLQKICNVSNIDQTSVPAGFSLLWGRIAAYRRILHGSFKRRYWKAGHGVRHCGTHRLPQIRPTL